MSEFKRELLSEEQSELVAGGKLFNNCWYDKGKLWSGDDPNTIYYFDWNGGLTIQTIDKVENAYMRGKSDQEIINFLLNKQLIRTTP